MEVRISVSEEWRFSSGVLPKPPQPTLPEAPELEAVRIASSETIRKMSPDARTARVTGSIVHRKVNHSTKWVPRPPRPQEPGGRAAAVPP